MWNRNHIECVYNGIKLEVYNKDKRTLSKHLGIKQYINMGQRNLKGNKKYFIEPNTNERTTYQSLWDAAKAVLRGEFIALTAYIKNEDKDHINNLSS